MTSPCLIAAAFRGIMVGNLGLEPRTTELTNLRTLPCRVLELAAPMLRKVLELFIQIPYTESLPIWSALWDSNPEPLD